MALVYDPFIGGIRWTWAPGAGIDMSGGTISVITPPEGVPYVAGPGISIYGATVNNTHVGSGRIELENDTFTFNPLADIVNVTGSSVTLQPDTAYKIFATSGPVSINATPPAAGKWAYDGHLEIFVASTGYVVTGTNVVLSQPLEPDAVNNCTVRFHDGLAIISVEDHVAGYIVVNGATSGEGSLYYGITTSTNDYVAFDASLNGTTIPLAGAVTNGEKHIVGNGYTETTLTGAVDCGTSKFTVANLSLQNVTVNGGVMTFGDAFIPSGSTVSVSGGGLAVEKVTGNGGVIDLGGSRVVVTSASAIMSGCLVTSGTTSGALLVGSNASLNIANAMLVDNGRPTLYGGGAVVVTSGGTAHVSGCTFSGNNASYGAAVRIIGGEKSSGVPYSTFVEFQDCTFSGNGAYTLNIDLENASCTLSGCVFDESQNIILRYGSAFPVINLAGANTIYSITPYGSGGIVTLSSGATLDLTGNTNAAPIAPGGGITFASGGATVQLGSTAGTVESSYMMDNVTLPAGAKLTNTAVVDLNGTGVTVLDGTSASASNVNVTGGTSQAAFMVQAGATANFNGVHFLQNGNSNLIGGVLSISSGGAARTAIVNLTSCVFDQNVSYNNRGVVAFYDRNTVVNISGSTFGQNQGIFARGSGKIYNVNFRDENKFLASFYPYNDGTAMTVTISSGAILDLTGNTNAAPIAPGGGITISSGGISIIDSAGSTHEFQNVAITGSTINNLGQILGATVSIPASGGAVGPWNIYTTLGSSTVSATAEAQELVIDGGLVRIEEL